MPKKRFVRKKCILELTKGFAGMCRDVLSPCMPLGSAARQVQATAGCCAGHSGNERGTNHGQDAALACIIPVHLQKQPQQYVFEFRTVRSCCPAGD